MIASIDFIPTRPGFNAERRNDFQNVLNGKVKKRKVSIIVLRDPVSCTPLFLLGPGDNQINSWTQSSLAVKKYNAKEPVSLRHCKERRKQITAINIAQETLARLAFPRSAKEVNHYDKEGHTLTRKCHLCSDNEKDTSEAYCTSAHFRS